MQVNRVTENAQPSSLVCDEWKRARRPGDGGRGNSAGLLPGMLEVPQPRQGRHLPAARTVRAALPFAGRADATMDLQGRFCSARSPVGSRFKLPLKFYPSSRKVGLSAQKRTNREQDPGGAGCFLAR